jgi:hypothetical protein
MRIITFDIHGEWPESVKNPYCKDTDLARENTAYWQGVDAAYHSSIEITDEQLDIIGIGWDYITPFSQYLRALISLISELFAQYDIGKETRVDFLKRLNAARDKEWIKWGNSFLKDLTTMKDKQFESKYGISYNLDTIDIVQQAWEKRKKEIEK